MFKIAVVIFRECLEIALLFGIILAATKPINKSRIYIITGALIGLVIAALSAFFAESITQSFNGFGDEIVDSGIILFTALMISWTVVWMQGYSSKIRNNLNQLSENINAGTASKYSLIIMISTVVLREGVEIILFVYSISSANKISASEAMMGFSLGCFTGFLTGSIIYMGLIKYAGRYIFQISSIMLTLIAAGLSSEAAGILTSSGVINLMSDQVWDTSWLIGDESILGKLFNITFGYDSRPNGMQITFYVMSILITMTLSKIRSSCNSSVNKIISLKT
ncbi:MAG: FTR1 family protein [Rickettsiaceae bacterium]|nr:FTR1 family protein [Rickettsiaceae bacterium]